MAGCAPSLDEKVDDQEWEEVKPKSKERTSHPIFKKLCIASGEVNDLSKGQIKERLKTFGLASRYKICMFSFC